MNTTDTLKAYLQRIEGVYMAILRTQAHCGEQIATSFNATQSGTAPLVKPLRTSADSLRYFADELTDEGAPPQSEEVVQAVLEFRAYLFNSTMPAMNELIERAEANDEYHRREILSDFLVLLGNQRMSAHVAALEKLFDKYL
ncbi:MAG: hypothetical protein FWG78_04605 [Coriobacteriia bacterium]|nr:hypothetical protein [Coriobacteriia bacterium]